eukprot:TRINITY_DN12184_c0_g4_i3.p1 TRINITY_DN12184_c0_g4~~TRINITY_DN12184_c0_g4_i3.p1  ORF type:complete len:1062 (+),score=192.41 TRINITY_DN12184_c0_g4_i3:111-3296(+)
MLRVLFLLLSGMVMLNTACLSDTDPNRLILSANLTHLTALWKGCMPSFTSIGDDVQLTAVPSLSDLIPQGLDRSYVPDILSDASDLSNLRRALAPSTSATVSAMSHTNGLRFHLPFCQVQFTLGCIVGEQNYTLDFKLGSVMVDMLSLVTPSPSIPDVLLTNLEVNSRSAIVMLNATRSIYEFQPSVWLSEPGNALKSFSFADMIHPCQSTIVVVDTLSDQSAIFRLGNLEPFTHYALRVNVVVEATQTYRRFVTGLSTSISVPDSQPQGLQIPLRGITPQSFLVRIDPIRPRTGIVHALQVEYVDTTANTTQEATLFDGFTVGNCVGKGEELPAYSWFLEDLFPNTRYQVRVRFVLDGGLFNPYQPPVRDRRAPIILPGFPLLPPGVSAYLTDWSAWEAETTAPAVQPAPRLQAERLSETTTRLSWRLSRLYAPGNVTFSLEIQSEAGELTRQIDVTDRNVRFYILNDTAVRLDNGNTVRLRVVNAMGMSEPSNEVLIQALPTSAMPSSGSDDNRRTLALAVGIPLAVIALLMLALVLYVRRLRRDGIVTFPPTDEFELDREKIEVGREVARGEFGVVHRGTYDGQLVAIKSLRPGTTRSQAQSFIEEAQVMKRLMRAGGHPNVLGLIGVTLQELPLQVLLPLIENGNLNTILLELSHLHPEYIDLHQQLLFALDIAQGMTFLAEQGVVHRDLAARNVLVTPEFVGVVADFGLARAVSNLSTLSERRNQGYYRKVGEVIAAVRWMPPEVFTDGLFEERSDVWAYGVTLWEIFSWGAVPYKDIPHDEVIGKVLKGVRLSQPETMPAILYLLCKRCWKPERPRFSTISEFLERVFDKYELPLVPIDQRQHPEDRLLALNAITPKTSPQTRRSGSTVSSEPPKTSDSLVQHTNGPRCKRSSQAHEQTQAFRRAPASTDTLSSDMGLAHSSQWGSALNALASTNERLDSPQEFLEDQELRSLADESAVGGRVRSIIVPLDPNNRRPAVNVSTDGSSRGSLQQLQRPSKQTDHRANPRSDSTSQASLPRVSAAQVQRLRSLSPLSAGLNVPVVFLPGSKSRSTLV